MLNPIFALLVLGAVLTAALGDAMPAVSAAGLASAKSAVELAIGLIGQMALWLGFMAILEAAGVMTSVARLLRPVMRRLFPDVPPDHPAMAAMTLNLGANILGLANAATPFGIKAMVELERLNPRPGVATNAMATFLAINTSGVAVLAFDVMAIRAELGAGIVSGVVLPTVFATACSTVVGVSVAKLTERLPRFAAERYPALSNAAPEPGSTAMADLGVGAVEEGPEPASSWGPRAVALLAGGVLVVAFVRFVLREASGGSSVLDIVKLTANGWLLPSLMMVIVLVGVARGVRVYEVFIEGAKGGFRVAVAILPYLVAILVAVGMFRASGALDIVISWLRPAADLLGFPPAALPMALVRPLSGSGALGVMAEIMKTEGPDSLLGFTVSVMNGSTATTFYVLAVYYGAIGVRAVRHTVWACLAADLTGALAAVFFARVFF